MTDRETELQEAVLNVSQRRKRGLLLKRIKNRLMIARDRASKHIADTGHLAHRARHLAVAMLKKRLAGKMGADYGKLAPSQKMMVDKKLEGKEALIGRIAAKLLPKVRAKEITRYRAKMSHVKEQAILEEAGDDKAVLLGAEKKGHKFNVSHGSNGDSHVTPKEGHHTNLHKHLSSVVTKHSEDDKKITYKTDKGSKIHVDKAEKKSGKDIYFAGVKLGPYKGHIKEAAERIRGEIEPVEEISQNLAKKYLTKASQDVVGRNDDKAESRKKSIALAFDKKNGDTKKKFGGFGFGANVIAKEAAERIRAEQLEEAKIPSKGTIPIKKNTDGIKSGAGLWGTPELVRKYQKETPGQEKAEIYKEEVEPVEEVSKKLLNRYLNKADKDHSETEKKAIDLESKGKEVPDSTSRKLDKRADGIYLAAKKTKEIKFGPKTKVFAKEEVEQVAEGSQYTIQFDKNDRKTALLFASKVEDIKGTSILNVTGKNITVKSENNISDEFATIADELGVGISIKGH